MNELQIFSNPKFGEIRTIEIDGEPWFVGKDVAKALGYIDTDKAIRDHVDDEDKKIQTRQNSGFGEKSENTTYNIPNRGLTIINESGTYSLIFSSKLPQAKEFKHWVTSEVLPTIRRTGSYQTPASEAELLLRLAQSNLAQEQRISALERRVDSLAPPPGACPTSCKPHEPVFEGLPADGKGFMDSMEVARILGREHNNVLKSIRTMAERARSEGIPVDEYFTVRHRVCGHNPRCPYYLLNETGIAMFSQSLKDWTLAEKLRAVFRTKAR